MPPTRLLVIRHGQSEWNAAGRWQGHADTPLTELGRSQAGAAAGNLPVIEAVWASDLARALLTAEIMAATIALPIRVDPRLRERAAGDWEGLTRGQIEAGWPHYLAQHHRPAGFEHDEDVLSRVLDSLADIHRNHPGQTVLVVSHGGVLRALERYCDTVDAAFPNLGGRFFTVAAHDGAVVVTAGERLFLLAEDEATYTSAP